MAKKKKKNPPDISDVLLDPLSHLGANLGEIRDLLAKSKKLTKESREKKTKSGQYPPDILDVLLDPLSHPDVLTDPLSYLVAKGKKKAKASKQTKATTKSVGSKITGM